MRYATGGGTPFGPQLLRRPLEGETTDPFEDYDFERDGEWLWPQLRFELMFLDANGSGLNMQFSEIQALDLGDVPDLLEQLRQQRRRYAEAAERARRKR
jgi:hypothetical protein